MSCIHLSSAAQEMPDSTVELKVISSVSEALKHKLQQVKQFSGEFTQQVIDDEGNIIQTANGTLKVSQPNLVNWHTLSPEETLIVSDGDNLWLYDPFVEQATVYTIDASVANTPILLLTSVDDSIWQQYHVQQSNERGYLITPKDDNSRVQSLELTFKDQTSYQIEQFTMIDSSGQASIIKLSNVIYHQPIDKKNFHFEPPTGVEIDDQR